MTFTAWTKIRAETAVKPTSRSVIRPSNKVGVCHIKRGILTTMTEMPANNARKTLLLVAVTKDFSQAM